MSGPYFIDTVQMIDSRNKKIFEIKDILLSDKWELDEFLRVSYDMALVLDSDSNKPYRIVAMADNREIHLFDGRSFVKDRVIELRRIERRIHRCINGVIDEGKLY